jgi:hypothetical protein
MYQEWQEWHAIICPPHTHAPFKAVNSVCCPDSPPMWSGTQATAETQRLLRMISTIALNCQVGTASTALGIPSSVYGMGNTVMVAPAYSLHISLCILGIAVHYPLDVTQYTPFRRRKNTVMGAVADHVVHRLINTGTHQYA